ncbi:MAG: hypothetical protein H7Z11_11385 [Verrucomicrobia bacterium]|nr:hypothetical protein [Leptolyngbya sp. ES-bin-22]
MKIKLSKAAAKFLQKLDRSSQQAVIAKIGTLKACLETQKIYPPEELDIKKLLAERERQGEPVVRPWAPTEGKR